MKGNFSSLECKRAVLDQNSSIIGNLYYVLSENYELYLFILPFSGCILCTSEDK